MRSAESVSTVQVQEPRTDGVLCASVSVCRLFFLGGSMLVSSACTFLLLLSFSQAAVICWQCLFYGVSVAAWNGLEVISVELYPSSKRYGVTLSLVLNTQPSLLSQSVP